MIAWIRWQLACLADDIRNIRSRIHYWYVGPPGRHSYDTGQMLAIEADLAARPWPLDAVPAPLSIPPAPGPELPPNACRQPLGDGFICARTAGHVGWCEADLPPDPYTWNPEAAILRATAPRLFAPDDEYWGTRYVELYGHIAWDTAEANRLRVECGLPRREPAPLRFRELTAA